MRHPFLHSALLLASLAISVHAIKGPSHKSLRALGMGNAFVAVVDDKEAIYYNPAGLNLINRLGNYKLDPERGYYPNNFLDMRLNLGVQGPAQTILDAYRLGNRVTDILDNASESEGQNPVLDSLSNHPELADDINQFDRLPIAIGSKIDMELAFHNFGGAIWVDAGVAPYVDGGVIMPFAGVDTFYVDAVMQGAFAFSPMENLSVGMGYKMAQRAFLNQFEVSALEWEKAQDSLENKFEETRDNVTDLGTIGHALEFGALYQLTREVRVGGSLRNLFLTELAGESITPDLTLGIAASPRHLQRNTAFARKVNFACDFADILNNDRNYKFFSHLNFGMEIEQVLLAVPSIALQDLRALKARIGAGFRGGYYTASAALEVLRVVELEVATWAEETGYYTGQQEKRFYMVQVGLGF